MFWRTSDSINQYLQQVLLLIIFLEYQTYLRVPVYISRLKRMLKLGSQLLPSTRSGRRTIPTSDNSSHCICCQENTQATKLLRIICCPYGLSTWPYRTAPHRAHIDFWKLAWCGRDVGKSWVCYWISIECPYGLDVCYRCGLDVSYRSGFDESYRCGLHMGNQWVFNRIPIISSHRASFQISVLAQCGATRCSQVGHLIWAPYYAYWAAKLVSCDISNL